ncbi:MAG: hypothetical protein ACFFAS_08465 [Promethearchaeota archaeon]
MAKNNGYILAILAGVLALISVLTPIVYQDAFTYSVYIWVWTLYYTKEEISGATDIDFYTENSDMVIWGLITTLIIVIAMVILLTTGAKAKHSSNNAGAWFLARLMLIATPIVFYVSFTEIEAFGGLFWDLFDPHFGFYGPIIAGISAMIAAFV